jgi:hypothetical protein
MEPDHSIYNLTDQSKEDLRIIDRRLRQSVWQLFKDGVLSQDHSSADWARQTVIKGLQFYSNPDYTHDEIRRCRNDAGSQVTAINAVNFLLHGSWKDGPHPSADESASQGWMESYRRMMDPVVQL